MKTSRTLLTALALTLPLAGAKAQQWTTNTLPPGLIAWWQAEGNMLDSAGSHNGTGSTAPTYGPGRFGQAFRFNGVDQSVQIPDGYAGLDGWTQFTLEAWVNFDTTRDSPGTGQCVISKVGNHRGPYSGNFGYQFGFANGATKLFCQFNTDTLLWPGYQTFADLHGPASTNVWYHVAATYDHNAVKLYLNGVPLVTNIIGPVTIANTIATLRLSKDDNDNVAFAGRIDDARVYSRALSESEIAHLYNGPPAPPETYFAEDVSPWPADNTGTVPRPVYPRSQAVAAQFLARLRGATTASFEGASTGSFPTNLTFGTNTAALSESDTNVCIVQTVSDAAATHLGLFPITGTNLLVLDVGLVTETNKFFRITFSSPQAAFGFYGMDAERNHFRLTLARADGFSSDLDPPITIPQGSAGVFYLGVVDRARPFTSVTFRNLESFPDAFGFDDLTIGSPNQVLPAAAQLRMTTWPWLQIAGTVGATYRIEHVAALEATNNWTVLTNLVLPMSPHPWFDPRATKSTNRFYRAVGIP